MVLSCIISEIKRDIGKKNTLSHTPPAFDTLIRASLSEFCYNVWYVKTIMVWLPDGKKSLRICLAILLQHRCVTDRRTDRHFATAQPLLYIASRARNDQFRNKQVYCTYLWH